jgi:hypothetical protein
MPKGECIKHGMRDYCEVCSHVFNDLQNGEFPPTHTIRFFSLLKLCSHCYEAGQMQRFENTDIWETVDKPEKEADAILKDYEESSQRGSKTYFYCMECFRTTELLSARKKGEKDPFIAYENTLTSSDEEIIDNLRKYLICNYPFKESDHITKGKALLIIPGKIDQPLQFIIYYVTEETEQKKVLSLIDNFFIGFEKKQRAVLFYEKENWIRTDKWVESIKQQVVGYHKGEEKPILEIRID